MIINTKNMVSITEANQNFSKIVKKVEQEGSVVVLKNNKPKYIITNYDENLNLSEDEQVEIIAKRILSKNKKAFEVLGND